MFGLNDNRNDSNQAGQTQPDPPVATPTIPPANGPTGPPPPPNYDAPGPVPMPPGKPSVSDVRTAYTEGVSEHRNDPPASTTQTDDLLQLKQDALQKLTPLLNHLGQTPEEKFKTTMMLIQASDNPQLISEAYEAANAIADEKIKAQALLDVVNEINYFTNKDNQPA